MIAGDAAAHVEAWDHARTIVLPRAITLAWLSYMIAASEAAKEAAVAAEKRLNDTMDRAERLGSVDLCLPALQRRDRKRWLQAMARLELISDMLADACRLHAKGQTT